jgi:hypothetical protein
MSKRDKVYNGIRWEPDGGKLSGFWFVGPVDGRYQARQRQIVRLLVCWVVGPVDGRCQARRRQIVGLLGTLTYLT